MRMCAGFIQKVSSLQQEAFLSDISNKQRFVTLLGEQLKGSGCQVFMEKEMLMF